MSIRNKKNKGEKLFDTLNIIIMCLFSIAFMYPVLNVFSISLSGSSPILRGEISFFPKQLTFEGYRDIFENKYIWLSYGNTIFVAAAGCAVGLIMTSFAAYPMAFGNFYGKRIFNYMILFTMWFGGGMIPTYLVMSKLKLINSLWALILLSAAPAYYIIILRSFFDNMPKSLIESAKLDGANDFICMFKIVLPTAKPALATIALWFVVSHWNNFMGPLIYLNDKEKYTLQVILNDIVLQASGLMYEITDTVQTGDGTMVIPQQVQNAVIVVSMLPMLIIYPFLQKYFVKGVMIGAIKG